MSVTKCLWCGRAFTPRATGRKAQRFCRPACRRAFDAAGRRWVAGAIAAGALTIPDLRNASSTMVGGRQDRCEPGSCRVGALHPLVMSAGVRRCSSPARRQPRAAAALARIRRSIGQRTTIDDVGNPDAPGDKPLPKTGIALDDFVIESAGVFVQRGEEAGPIPELRKVDLNLCEIAGLRLPQTAVR